jgi:photosystem II stability/assembly factor-like uncharacterized protein
VTAEAAPGTQPGTGLYRSDDAGATWYRPSNDNRPVSRVNEVTPHVSAKDPDTIIVTDVVSFKSTDGGKTFTPFRGAPGGDDNQNLWWNPDNPDIILLTIDQGAVVTLNGGQTWSSWFTQPTAALYHVMTDNAFPYRVCGGQQDSGSVCVASRGNDGQITFREWHPVGIEEYGYAAPDPLDPDLVYGGKVTRYNRRTGQTSDVGPVAGRGGGPAAAGAPSYRTVRTQPVVFSQVDNKTLFYGNNVLWKTLDGGVTWKQISPDLTRESWKVPKNVGSYAEKVTATTRGSIGAQVIYTIGPSYKDINRIWIGTDDGVIATTTDGGAHWANVTPPAITDFMKVFTIDAGRFDAQTAYAAVNTLRLDDMNPYIFRTHDGGQTWTKIVNGIPGGAPVSVVREDPKRKGLLYAGSETQVYVSFDDGDHWQSLRLNMPASSVRDLVIKDDDLVVGTHGRGIWILDDITPLRQIGPQTAQQDAVLFAPTTACALEHEHRHAAAARRADDAESARGRDHQLLPEGRGERPGDARDPRWREGHSQVHERRRGAPSEQRDDDAAALLVPRADGALDGSRHASLHVGRAPAAGGWREPRGRPHAADCRGAAQHGAGADDAVGEPGQLYRSPHGERQELHAADRREGGSAREDASGDDAAGIHRVARGLGWRRGGARGG